MDTSSGYMDVCRDGRQHHWYLTHLPFFSIFFLEKAGKRPFFELSIIFFPCCDIKKKIMSLSTLIIFSSNFIFLWHHSIGSSTLFSKISHLSLANACGIDGWIIFQAVISCWFLVTHLHANSAPLPTGLKWAYICSILGCTLFSIKPEEDKSSCWHWIKGIFFEEIRKGIVGVYPIPVLLLTFPAPFPKLFPVKPTVPILQ